MTTPPHIETGRLRACRVALVDDRPLPRAVLGLALQREHVDVVVGCTDLAELAQVLPTVHPGVAVLSNGLSDRDRRLLAGVGCAPTPVTIVLVTETPESVSSLYDAGLVAAVVRPDVGVDHLRRLVERVHSGRRFVVGPRPRSGATPTPGVVLTPRETQVLHLLAAGASNEVISVHLGISVNTVRSHVQTVLRKLGEGRRVRAVRRAGELGLLDRLPV